MNELIYSALEVTWLSNEKWSQSQVKGILLWNIIKQIY